MSETAEISAMLTKTEETEREAPKKANSIMEREGTAMIPIHAPMSAFSSLPSFM